MHTQPTPPPGFGAVTQVQTLVDVFRWRVATNGEQLAFSFESDEGDHVELTYRQLDERARAIAASLQELASKRKSRSTDRVLLLFPAGLEFIEAFFGCLYAGLPAVPACYPKPRRPMPRLSAIAQDCQASIVLTTDKTLRRIDIAKACPELVGLDWLSVDTLPSQLAEQWECPELDRNDLAFLQYTSGSTSEPKGVMVTHANLLNNLEVIREGFGIAMAQEGEEPCCGVFWLPAYHDMGLIGGILTPLYVGGTSRLMSPTAFLQRPLRWLAAISEHRAVISGAPNFAYDLCVRRIFPAQRADLDLSSWQVAFCGAEPIRRETVDEFIEAFACSGFDPEAFYPCYGMAEATLMVSGKRMPGSHVSTTVLREPLARHEVVPAGDAPTDEVQHVISCGTAFSEHEIVIVEPDSRQRLAEGRVGEIWLRGPSVAAGYWNRPEQSLATFGAEIDGEPGDNYLRTGDLGFFDQGELYVTGRAKDVIIIRGRNHYPHDIEATVDDAHAALRRNAGAAVAVDIDGEERLVIIHEILREYRGDNLQRAIERVRRAVAEEHEIEPHAVLLLRQASLPITTSGKVQRNLCRQLYLAGELKAVAEWTRPMRTKIPHTANGQSQTMPTGRSHTNGRAHAAASSHAGDFSESGVAVLAIEPLRLGSLPMSVDAVDRLAERIESWLLEWLVERAGVAAQDTNREKAFSDYGLDSLTAVEMSQELEQWLGIELTPILAWNYPTPATLSQYLARKLGGLEVPELESIENDTEMHDAGDADADFERLLAEIEELSESEAERVLTEQDVVRTRRGT